MVKPKFSRRITAAASPAVRESPGNLSRGKPLPAWHRRKSIAHITVNRETMNIKHQQMEEVTEYCKTRGCQGMGSFKNLSLFTNKRCTNN